MMREAEAEQDRFFIAVACRHVADEYVYEEYQQCSVPIFCLKKIIFR